MAAVPLRPSLDELRKRLGKGKSPVRRKHYDGYVRETFSLPRIAARQKAKEWFSAYPKAAYWTEIESWYELPDDVIEFTIRRLPSAD